MRIAHKEEKGFTLIELLIVIGIIGFLAAAVLVAVDPVKRIQDARDARRSSEANAILNAILTKQVDDRALFAGTATAPIVTSASLSQVITTSDVNVACNTPATAPACPTQTLSVVAGKGCVANIGGPNTGTAVTNGSGTITGTGTFLNTEMTAGDTVTSDSGGSCVLATVTSATAGTCTARTLTGTMTSAVATITGVGTSFTTQVSIGDVLTSASTGICTVLTVPTNTSITCSATPSPAFAGTATTAAPFPAFAGAITDSTRSINPAYIATMPIDPRGAGTVPTVGNLAFGSTNSGYYIHRTVGNRIEVGACYPEQAATISVKR